MTKLKCNGCDRIIEKPSNYIEGTTCKECGDYFSEIEGSQDSKDDDIWLCEHCKKKFKENEQSYGCDECSDEPLCFDCTIIFDNSSDICKKCIDKFYSREIKTIEKIVEKPIIKHIDKESKRSSLADAKILQKTRFD